MPTPPPKSPQRPTQPPKPVAAAPSKMTTPPPRAPAVAPKTTPPPPRAAPPTIPPRPAQVVANIKRAEQRDARRVGTQQAASQLQSQRPRPAVRPAAPPQRIMPATPPPPPRMQAVVAPKGGPPAAMVNPNWETPTAAALRLNTVSATTADQTIASGLSALNSSIGSLQSRASFEDAFNRINNVDSTLTKVSELLESARSKGYAYQSDLEETLYHAMGKWDAARPQILDIVNQQSYSFQTRLTGINTMVMSLNSSLGNPVMATNMLRNAQSQVNNLLSLVSRVESDIQNRFGDIETQAQGVNNRLSNIHWAMDQLSGAKFQPASGEDLVMAVKCRWDKEGKEDPEGVLFLSNRRLIFERKEKVATKKVLFVTTASELVQEVLIDQPLGNVREAKPDNKGLFGHQDYLLTQFSDPKLGQVAFHIYGQSSKDWAALVERARSAQIEQDRHIGGGLSYADLSKPLTHADILSAQNEVNQLQDEMMLQAARQELGNLESEVNALARKLTGLRERGYVVEKDLEGDALVLTNQWDRVKANTNVTLDSQTRLLGEQMSGIQHQLAQLVGLSANLAAARPIYMQLKSSLASSQAQSEAANALVLAQYDQYADELESLDTHLEWIDWMLGAIDTASFKLLVTECGVAATEAVFEYPGLEPENGILFLTDQRLLWEDRVGTYELKVNVPLPEVLDVQREADEQNGQQCLVFSLGPSGPLPTARFQLSLPVADDWLKMVGRARSGGYTQDRAVEVSEAELERIKNAPTQCSKCGASFTAPILRGQQEITCEYCGLVVRL